MLQFLLPLLQKAVGSSLGGITGNTLTDNLTKDMIANGIGNILRTGANVDMSNPTPQTAFNLDTEGMPSFNYLTFLNTTKPKNIRNNNLT